MLSGQQDQFPGQVFGPGFDRTAARNPKPQHKDAESRGTDKRVGPEPEVSTPRHFGTKGIRRIQSLNTKHEVVGVTCLTLTVASIEGRGKPRPSAVWFELAA